MIFTFNVNFDGYKEYHIDASDLEEARDQLSIELEWDVPGLRFYQILNEERGSKDEPQD